MKDQCRMKRNNIKDLWGEKWLPIVTKVESKTRAYFFSNYGRVKSLSKSTNIEKLVKGSISVQKYNTLNLHLEGHVRQNFYVHRLVAEAFVSQPTTDHSFIIHIDNDLLNNYYGNLRWVTREELTQFRISKGAYRKDNPQKLKHYKLNAEKVRSIKKALSEGEMKKKEIAAMFGISLENLRKINKGDYWAHIQSDPIA